MTVRSVPEQTWPLQQKGRRDRSALTAVVKGAGPTGLASATGLALEGFQVRVVEKRAERPEGDGRRNMVCIRPEALRQLENLGALQYLQDSGHLTHITEGANKSEIHGYVLPWEIGRYPSPDYQAPEKVEDQRPCVFVNLGHLEDALGRAARDAGVCVFYEANLDLRSSPETKRFQAMLGAIDGTVTDLGFPDLVVCASGKGDEGLKKQLGFERRVGVKIDDDHLPESPDRDLQLGDDNELESQLFAVYGISTPTAKMGVMDHNVRSGGGTGPLQQPVVEIAMFHQRAAHCVMQLPRGFPHENVEELDRYIVARTNRRLGTQFCAVQEMRDLGALVYGDPLRPVLVETSTAPRFVFGSNVVLVGDVAMSCSPTPGFGAEVGVTFDSQSIQTLAAELKETAGTKKADTGEDMSPRQLALDTFNTERAEAAVIYSQESRPFYLATTQARDVVKRRKRMDANPLMKDNVTAW